MRRFLTVVRVCVLTGALGLSLFASAEVPVPALTGHVIDQTGTLTSDQKNTLEQALTAFEARKGSQVAVLIVPTTKPEEIEQFGIRVADKWKLGRRKIDDGVILIVAKEDRTLRIEVGYGLEGALTDALSKRIIEQSIVPRFKQQDFYGGITAGVFQIVRVLEGEQLAPPAASADTVEDYFSYLPILFILALVIGRVLRSVLGRMPGAVLTSGAVAVIGWWLSGAIFLALLGAALAFFITLLGGFNMGGGGGFGGGSGRGGGSSGGGMSGGGGGFGGGGSSGRW